MKFEEEFPSLKGKDIAMGTNFYPDINKMKFTDVFHKKHIKKHCLDKARVKEAIGNLAKRCMFDSSYKEPPAWWFQLSDELGLNIEKELGI